MKRLLEFAQSIALFQMICQWLRPHYKETVIAKFRQGVTIHVAGKGRQYVKVRDIESGQDLLGIGVHFTLQGEPVSAEAHCFDEHIIGFRRVSFDLPKPIPKPPPEYSCPFLPGYSFNQNVKQLEEMVNVDEPPPIKISTPQ